MINKTYKCLIKATLTTMKTILITIKQKLRLKQLQKTGLCLNTSHLPADVEEKDEEKQEYSENDSILQTIVIEAEEGDTEDEEEKVVGEVRKYEMVEGAEEKQKKRAGRDVDRRAEEVKAEV